MSGCPSYPSRGPPPGHPGVPLFPYSVVMFRVLMVFCGMPDQVLKHIMETQQLEMFATEPAAVLLASRRAGGAVVRSAPLLSLRPSGTNILAAGPSVLACVGRRPAGNMASVLC